MKFSLKTNVRSFKKKLPLSGILCCTIIIVNIGLHYFPFYLHPSTFHPIVIHLILHQIKQESAIILRPTHISFQDIIYYGVRRYDIVFLGSTPWMHKHMRKNEVTVVSKLNIILQTTWKISHLHIFEKTLSWIGPKKFGKENAGS